MRLRATRAIERQLGVHAIQEGIESGFEATLQDGFNRGFESGLERGKQWGQLLGVVGLMEQLLEHIGSSESHAVDGDRHNALLERIRLLAKRVGNAADRCANGQANNNADINDNDVIALSGARDDAARLLRDLHVDNANELLSW